VGARPGPVSMPASLRLRDNLGLPVRPPSTAISGVSRLTCACCMRQLRCSGSGKTFFDVSESRVMTGHRFPPRARITSNFPFEFMLRRAGLNFARIPPVASGREKANRSREAAMSMRPLDYLAGERQCAAVLRRRNHFNQRVVAKTGFGLGELKGGSQTRRFRFRTGVRARQTPSEPIRSLGWFGGMRRLPTRLSGRPGSPRRILLLQRTATSLSPNIRRAASASRGPSGGARQEVGRLVEVGQGMGRRRDD